MINDSFLINFVFFEYYSKIIIKYFNRGKKKQITFSKFSTLDADSKECIKSHEIDLKFLKLLIEFLLKLY